MKLCFLVIFFIQLACVPNLFKFEFTDNYNIIDSTFDLYNICSSSFHSSGCSFTHWSAAAAASGSISCIQRQSD